MRTTSAIAGHFARTPSPAAVSPRPKARPKPQPTLGVPDRVGRLVFEGAADAGSQDTPRIRVRCAIEHGGCGLVTSMLARHFEVSRGHCGCLGKTGEACEVLDRFLTIDGRTLPLVAHVREAMQRHVRIDFGTVRRRIVEGWDPERAVRTPMRRRGE